MLTVLFIVAHFLFYYSIKVCKIYLMQLLEHHHRRANDVVSRALLKCNGFVDTFVVVVAVQDKHNLSNEKKSWN